MQNITKGATPIIKNIIVVDEQGKNYGATYPKRAKGLVKNGRARFVDENTICLACPPDINLEENKMTTNIENTVNTTPVLTAKEIFDQIVVLQNMLPSLSHLTSAVEAIYNGEDESINTDDEDNRNDDTSVFKTKSVTCLVEAFSTREETYRKILGMYEEMYDDLTSGISENPVVHQQTQKLILGFLESDQLSDEGKIEAIGSIIPDEEENRDFFEEAIARIFDNVAEDDQLAAIRIIVSNH